MTACLAVRKIRPHRMSRQLPIVEKLQADLAELRYEFTVELPKVILVAREHGDLSENAEYHAAKERQGFVNARMAQIEQRLRELSLYNWSSIPTDVIGYGSKVDLEDVDSGESVSYSVVFAEEVDTAGGTISMTSPVGQALLNRAEGDEVTIRLPSGTKTYEVLNVVTIHDSTDD